MTTTITPKSSTQRRELAQQARRDLDIYRRSPNLAVEDAHRIAALRRAQRHLDRLFALEGIERMPAPEPTCATCGKAIVQVSHGLHVGAWRHKDDQRTSNLEAQFCETGTGYVRIRPAGVER